MSLFLMSSLVEMIITGTRTRKANPPRFCYAASVVIFARKI